MKSLFYPIYFLLPCLVFSQIGLGTRDPHHSAVLELESSDKGLLIPRLSEAERDKIGAPATGLIIYNADTDKIEFNSGTPDAPVWKLTSSTSTETTGGPTNPNAWVYSYRKYNAWNTNTTTSSIPASAVINSHWLSSFSGNFARDIVADRRNRHSIGLGPDKDESVWIDFFHQLGNTSLYFGVGNRGPQTWQLCLRNTGASTATFEFFAFNPSTSGGRGAYTHVNSEIPPVTPDGDNYFYAALHIEHSLWLTAEKTMPVNGFIFFDDRAYEYKAMATRRKNDNPEGVYAGIGYRSLGPIAGNINLIKVIGKTAHEVMLNDRDGFWKPMLTKVIGTMNTSPSDFRSLIRAIGEAVPVGVQEDLDFQNFVLEELEKKRPLTNPKLEALIEEIVKTVPAAVQSQVDFWVKVFDLVGSGQLSDKTMQALILAIPVLAETHNSLYGGFNF